MTRVDFYLTQTGQQKQLLVTACRLAEKASAKGHHVFIHADDEPQAQQLDTLLWTFNHRSFVPHSLIASEEAITSDDPVFIGHDHDPEFEHDVMINVSSAIPNFFSRFKRVVEIVSGDEEQRDLARERFKFYRDRGYALNTHEIKG